jgi:hypothetical protein
VLGVWCEVLYMAVVFSMPPCFGKDWTNSKSLLLSLLGNLSTFLPFATRERDEADDNIEEANELLIFEPTVLRKKWSVGPATTGMQAQMNPMSPSMPVHTAILL